jgi:hypothetical protein
MSVFVSVVCCEVQVYATGRGILPSGVCLSLINNQAKAHKSHIKNARGGLARGCYIAPSYDET